MIKKKEKLKVLYKTVPKSRQRVYGPCGVCFDMSWEKIFEAVQEYRSKYGYTCGIPLANDERLGTVFVKDTGVQFNFKDSPL